MSASMISRTFASSYLSFSFRILRACETPGGPSDYFAKMGGIAHERIAGARALFCNLAAFLSCFAALASSLVIAPTPTSASASKRTTIGRAMPISRRWAPAAARARDILLYHGISRCSRISH